jgi:hypothetical protein
MPKKRDSQPSEKRQCPRCSAWFTPKKRQIYCTPECRRPRVKFRLRKCRRCKIKFRPKRKDAIYCNHLCRSRAGLERCEAKLAKKGLSKPRKPLETLQCVCGISFVQTRPWQKYCSGLCGNRQRQKRRIERKTRELIESGFDPSDGGPGSGLEFLSEEKLSP